MNERPVVGIVGYGVVGRAVEAGFRDKCEIILHDPKLALPFSLKQLVEESDLIFVSVPTPFNSKTGEYSSDILYSVIDEINDYSPERCKPTVIIKSAVPPSCVADFENKFKNIYIVISPEYLTESSSIRDFVNQKVMILGGNVIICHKIIDFYTENSICNKACNYGITTAPQSALIKYMENSFLAMKNIFNNQFKILHDKVFDAPNDDSFNDLMDIFYMDERMGVNPFKYRIPGPDGDIGYGGKCLPKDVKTIISEAKKAGAHLTLMEEVDRINEEIRTDKNWLSIEGAVI